jgi:hypothetical protein
MTTDDYGDGRTYVTVVRLKATSVTWKPTEL